ncbi:SNF2-related protein [Candidatus Vampirococcus lugosii]|uniref:Helicase n=1 Tax=Candidatus Vampirococcus lugosii TaxID=2789015 RepID=A0ABS5QL82_9BACT|nr:helicase [Candidatus Vampirococcus lugosii]
MVSNEAKLFRNLEDKFGSELVRKGGIYFMYGNVLEIKIDVKNIDFGSISFYGVVVGSKKYSVSLTYLYNLDFKNYSCDCPAFKTYGRCKHIVAFIMGIIDRFLFDDNFVYDNKLNDVINIKDFKKNSSLDMLKTIDFDKKNNSNDDWKDEKLYKVKIEFDEKGYYYKDMFIYLLKCKLKNNGVLSPGRKLKKNEFVKVPAKFKLLEYFAQIDSGYYNYNEEKTFDSNPELFFDLVKKYDNIYIGNKETINVNKRLFNLKFNFEKLENGNIKINPVLVLDNLIYDIDKDYLYYSNNSLLSALKFGNELIFFNLPLDFNSFKELLSNDIELSTEEFEEFKKAKNYKSLIQYAYDLNGLENFKKELPYDNLEVIIDNDFSNVEVKHNVFYKDEILEENEFDNKYIFKKDELIERDLEKENNLYDQVNGIKVLADEVVGNTFYKNSTKNIDSFFDEIEKQEKNGKKVVYKQKTKRISSKTLSAKLDVKSGIDRFDASLKLKIGDKKINSAKKILESIKKGDNTVILDDGTAFKLKDNVKKVFKELEEIGINNSNIEDETYKIGKYNIGLLGKNSENDENDKILEYDLDHKGKELKEKISNFDGISNIEVPKEIIANLRDYQKKGFQRINFLKEYNFGGILADDMGLGKTIQTISMLQREYNNNIKTPSLIVCPTSLTLNWESEIDKFAPNLKAQVIENGKEGFENIEKDTNIIIISYGIIANLVNDGKLKKQKFHYIVVDESQNIKNPNAIRSKSIYKLKGKYRLALSGTPIENNLTELWSVFNFLMPGFLGNLSSFSKKYKNANKEELKILSQKIKPFVIRRTKEEVLKEIPPKIENITYLRMPQKQKKFYDELKEAYKLQIGKKLESEGLNKARFEVLDALLKLRQASLLPQLIEGNNVKDSAKLDYIKENIEEMIQSGHNLLIFSQFTKFIGYIIQILKEKKISYCHIEGKTKAKDRQKQVEKFNSGEISVFVISLKAGGTGLNLTQADYVLHMDPWWNSSVEKQATDRAHRIGQQKTVFVNKLIMKDSIEEKVLKLQEKKKDLIKNVFEGDFTGNLSEDDIKYIFD